MEQLTGCGMLSYGTNKIAESWVNISSSIGFTHEELTELIRKITLSILLLSIYIFAVLILFIILLL